MVRYTYSWDFIFLLQKVMLKNVWLASMAISALAKKNSKVESIKMNELLIELIEKTIAS